LTFLLIGGATATLPKKSVIFLEFFPCYAIASFKDKECSLCANVFGASKFDLNFFSPKGGKLSSPSILRFRLKFESLVGF